ncbi:MAG: response regulator [Bacteroidota bacterium]
MTESPNVRLALIVDDDEINNFICIKNIRDANFAENAIFRLRAREALDLLVESAEKGPEEVPDVIFLDINMPLMNAWEFLDEFKTILPKLGKDVSLFILSSSVYRKDIDKSTTYDVVKDYLVKPLSKAKLEKLKEQYFS